MKLLKLAIVGMIFLSYPYWAITAPLRHTKILAQKGDVIISVDGARLKCDQTICPEQSYRCDVVKELDPNDSQIILRTNICYSNDGLELLRTKKKFMKKNNFNKYLDLSADRDGIVLLNEEITQGFYLSRKNLELLKGKSKNYIKLIEKNLNDATAKVASLVHKKFV